MRCGECPTGSTRVKRIPNKKPQHEARANNLLAFSVISEDAIILARTLIVAHHEINFCPLPGCHDIRSLHSKGIVSCKCGQSSGQYLEDDLNVIIRGAAIPLGILNSSLVKAVRARPSSGLGAQFDAFVIPHQCPTVRKADSR